MLPAQELTLTLSLPTSSFRLIFHLAQLPQWRGTAILTVLIGNLGKSSCALMERATSSMAMIATATS